jgi:integrase
MRGSKINRGGNTWLLRVFVGRDPDTGRQIFDNQTVHCSSKEADKILAAKVLAYENGDLVPGSSRTPRVTVGTLLDALLTDYRVNERKSYEQAEIQVRCHLRPYFGNVVATQLTTERILEYITRRRAKGAANATINRALSALKRAYGLAMDSTPPKISHMPRIPKLKENNARRGFFEHHEYLTMSTHLPDEIRPVLSFAYYTGMRKEEILGLRWDQVDLLEPIVRLEPGETKNNEAREFTPCAQLHAVLKMQKEIRDRRCPNCPWVFFRVDKKGRSTQIKRFDGAWNTAAKKAGLWDESRGKRGGSTKLLHDNRRTGVRNQVRAGSSEAEAMKISGHKTRAVFDRYNIVDGRDLKRAADQLGRYIDQKEQQLRELQNRDNEEVRDEGTRLQ